MDYLSLLKDPSSLGNWEGDREETDIEVKTSKSILILEALSCLCSHLNLLEYIFMF